MNANYRFSAMFALSVGLFATALFAAEPKPANGSGADAKQSASQPANSSPAKKSDNRWRYRFRNGHWWYWQPDKHWVFWTGKKWQDYDRQSYSQWLFEREMAQYEAEAARLGAAPYPGGYPLYFGTYGGYYGSGPNGHGSFYWRGSLPGSFPSWAWQGNLNIGTSVGGYMGSALSGPAGY